MRTTGLFGVSPFQQVLSQQHHPHEPHPENEVSSSIPILRHAFESWKCLTFDVVVEVLRKRGLQYVECVKWRASEDCGRLSVADNWRWRASEGCGRVKMVGA